MSTVVSPERPASSSARASSARAEALAVRLEQGAAALAALATTVTDDEWRTRLPADGRTIGVVIHHVASVYPVEIELARVLAAGQAITGVTWAGINSMNARHADEHGAVTRADTIDLLRRASAEAATAIRALSDEDLDRAAAVSLYADAPLTSQFVLEDHAVRHSYHHLARIQAALKKTS